MKKLFLVDALNVLFRSYYAIGRMTNPKGESTNALFGFIRTIYKLIQDFSSDHLVVVFDGPQSKQRRTDLYAEYKSNREAMPEDLYSQLERAHTFCKIAGIPYLAIPGVEADDTIGTITKWSEKGGKETFICTSDKDLCQLVSDKTFLINLSKENLLVDREKVKEIHGVEPEQIPDLLGLVGDASDNIPGLEGFGPKTASTLLQEFQTLENLLDHPDKVKGEKKQETLRNGKAIALLSKELATLHYDVEVPLDETFYTLRAPDLTALREFYTEMNFVSLLKQMGESAPTPALQQQEEVSYTLIDTREALEHLIATLSKHKEICIDTETTDVRPTNARLVGIGLGVKPGEAWYIPMNGKLGKGAALALIKPFLENPHHTFYGHNIKYDLHVLMNEGLPMPRLSFDTMIASYLLTPQNQRHNLDLLSLERFGKAKIPIESLIGKGKNQLSMDVVPVEKVKDYCCEDIDYTCRLKKLFHAELAKENLLSLFETVELPLIPVLFKMERNGIFVDVQTLEHLSHSLNQKISALQTEIFSLAGESFNLNSPKQLSTILYEKLQIPCQKKSTAADVLESLEGASPIIGKILEYRTLEKLRSTYVDSLPEEISFTTHRIHCTFNQSVAATGRLSCQNPNLQNIPVRGEEGKKIRTAFKPQHPGTSFLAADYSQIELRLLAHFSEDPNLLAAFAAGEDIHASTAALVFDVPLAQVDSEMRGRAKAVNFGILYGQQAYGLSQQLGIDFHEASNLITTYFNKYPRVRTYLEECKESARKTGYAITPTGRKRPIPDIDSKNPMLRAAAERLAVNTPLQGSNADIIKLAMIKIHNWLAEEKEAGMMILQIHDELLFEVPDHQLEKTQNFVKSAMEGVFSLKVPLTVDIAVGKNWGEC